MEILQESDIIQCLKGSVYYKTFSKTGKDSKKNIHVPTEYVVMNDNLKNINNYEDFFNILIILNFWMIEVYPNEIYHWIIYNISQISKEHLLDSILCDTEIVKQINIFISVTNRNNYNFTETYIELKLAGYDYFADVVKINKPNDFREHICPETSDEILNFAFYDYLYRDAQFKFYDNESYLSDLKNSSFYNELQHYFLIDYGIVLNFEKIKELIINLINDYIKLYELEPEPKLHQLIYAHENICPWDFQNDHLHKQDNYLNQKHKIYDKPYSIRDMHKIKQTKFKKNKRYFKKH